MSLATRFGVAGTLAEVMPHAIPLTPAHPGDHRYRLPNGVELAAHIRGPWLALEWNDGRVNGTKAWWPLLERNAHLPPSVKVVRTPDGRTSRLRAELLIGPSLLWRLPELWPDPATVSEAAEDAPDPDPTCWIALVRECLLTAGWPVTERGSERFAVGLGPARGLPLTALVEPADGLGVRMALGLGAAAAAAVTREAVARFLVLGSADLPPVRPVTGSHGTAHAPRLEVVFGWGATAEELEHGIEALALAGRLIAPAVRALGAERVAREYLASRGARLG
jgi:hypothetical protein